MGIQLIGKGWWPGCIVPAGEEPSDKTVPVITCPDGISDPSAPNAIGELTPGDFVERSVLFTCSENFRFAWKRLFRTLERVLLVRVLTLERCRNGLRS